MIPKSDELASIENGRERMILAAARLLADADGTVLAEGLKQKAIADLAGQHPSNFGHHFRGLAEVVQELGQRFHEVGAQNETSKAIIDHLVDSFSGDLSPVLRMVSDVHFEKSMAEGDRELQLALWALLHNDPQHRAMLVSMIGQANTSITVALSATLERWGLELRAPWDIDSVAAVFRALADGLTVQASMDQDVGHLLGLTVLSLYPMITRFAHDGAMTVDAAVAGFGSEAAAHWRDGQQAAAPPDRDAVVAAVRSQLTKRGYNSLKLDDVAREAGIPARQIAIGLGGVDNLVCEAFRSCAVGSTDEFDFDEKSGLFSSDDMLRRQLARLAELADEVPELTRAVLAMMTGGGSASNVAEGLCATLEEPLVQVLTIAAKEELLVPEVVPDQASRALVLGILLRSSLGVANGGLPLDLITPLFR